jgi:hypothetical protein
MINQVASTSMFASKAGGMPSEICALDFKRKFRRSVICPDSATIDIDWSILEILLRGGVATEFQKIPLATAKCIW